MPKEKGLSQEQQQAFDYYYGEKADENSARLYQEWLALNSHSASQLKTIRGKLASHDQARSRRQRWRVLWQLWRQSGFSSLTYYRNLIKFEELLLQLNKAYQSRMQSQKAQESKLAHAGNYETVGGRTTSLIKTPYEKALVRLLNDYSAQLEGAFSKIKRYMRFIWRYIKMLVRSKGGSSEAVSLNALQASHRLSEIKHPADDSHHSLAAPLSDLKEEQKSGPLQGPTEPPAVLPQNQAPLASIGSRIWNNLARKWRILSKKYDHDALQRLFDYNLKKMQDFIPAKKHTDEACDRFAALCKARLELEASYAKYKERYRPDQWKLQSKADESRRNEQIKGMNIHLDKFYNEVYKTALQWLFPELQQLLISQLREEFEIFKLDPSKRQIDQLKKGILGLKKQALSQTATKQAFYDNHLRLLMRRSLNEMRVEILGMTALSDSPPLNQLIHWLENEEKNLLAMVAPARVDENVKLFAQLDVNEVSQCYVSAIHDVSAIYADRRHDVQDRESKEEKEQEEKEVEIELNHRESVLASQRSASKTVADIEGIWLEHRWDESDPKTAEWKKEALLDLAKTRTEGADKNDEAIKSGPPEVAKWVALRRSLTVVGNNKNYLREVRNENDFLYYVFLCAYFELNWDESLTSHAINAAYYKLSLIVHPNRAPMFKDSKVNLERNKCFNHYFGCCKFYHTRLVQLFEERERLFQIKESTSAWVISKHVVAGSKHRKELLDDIEKSNKYLNEMQAMVDKIEENTRQAEQYRVARKAAEGKLMAAEGKLMAAEGKLMAAKEELKSKDEEIEYLRRQVEALKSSKGQPGQNDQREEKPSPRGVGFFLPAPDLAPRNANPHATPPPSPRI